MCHLDNLQTYYPLEVVLAHSIDINWTEKYVGKSWQAVPNPPASYNCGELLRHVYLDMFNYDAHKIEADANSLKSSLKAFSPSLFGLRALREDEQPREFDIVFFARSKYFDHCGVLADTQDGLMVLHCLQSCGVVLESQNENLTHGFKKLEAYRLINEEVQILIMKYQENKYLKQATILINSPFRVAIPIH
jgi:hypothetical protein